MNLKRTLFTGLAAIGLMASIAAPVATAQTGHTDDADAIVVISNNGGVFIPEFCGDVNLGTHDITAIAGSTATGTMGICYWDTRAYRQNFKASIDASDFESGVPMPVPSSDTYSIPAQNFKIVRVYNPQQDQWRNTNPAPGSANTCPFVPGVTGAPNVYDIGDIGGFNGTSSSYGDGAYVTDGSALWSGPALSENPFVNYAWSGVGTGNGGFACNALGINGTYSPFDVALQVPAGAAAGTYVSDLTLTVTFTAP
jgi:hypothetical protein